MNNKENMNEYDDQDDQDDLSSSNSFRARSNTWPLNRPDITVPSSGVCIDETLPEIELEDDDLFTTNENWATGLVDNQDIMSWDPILNAQNQQQSQQQPATIHHHHQHHQQQQQQQQQRPPPPPPPATQQQHHHHHHQHQPPQAQHQTHPVNHHHHHQTHQPPPPIPITQGHQRHQSIHLHNQQQPSHHQHHHHRHDLHQHPQNDPFLDVVSNNPNNVLLTSQASVVQLPQQQSQLQQRLSPSQHPNHVQHQTLNSVHCLDQDEPNEYHIHQMHHLSLENSQPSQPHESSQQDHYAPTLTSMCIHNPSTDLNNDTSYNITTNHHDQNHHHLQSLSSARYEIDPQGEYELKPPHDETLGQHVEHQPLNQPPHHHHHHHHPQMIHLHHHQQQQTHHQLQTISSSLDNHSGSSHLLSSSLSTSGIGLSGDLEDLDYNHTIDSTIVPSNAPHDDQQQQKSQTAETQPLDGVASDAKQSDSTSTSKTKLNAPRRNAWGNMSYADLISQAINSTSDKRLTLSQIYDWMVQHVPYFKDKGDSNSSAGWKNSVRHNLSLHSRFKRLQNEGTGKSSWWTINPEANVGKCARRRAASMEASKYEKKRGRAKKKAEAIRQGLIPYPSLSSLNGSTTALGQQDSQAQTLNNKFQDSSQTSQKSEQTQKQQPQPQAQTQTQSQPQTQTQSQPPSQAQPQSQPQLQDLDQFADLQPPPVNGPQLQIQTLDHYVIDQPSQQQQQHLQHLQQSDAQSCDDLSGHVQRQHEQSLFTSQQTPQHQELRYEENNESNKIHQQQQQQPQQQQQQYYYPFELSTAL